MEELIKINDLHVEVAGKEILKGLNLTIKPGEIHVIMGHSNYEVTSGEIILEGEKLEEVSVTERARNGRKGYVLLSTYGWSSICTWYNIITEKKEVHLSDIKNGELTELE